MKEKPWWMRLKKQIEKHFWSAIPKLDHNIRLADVILFHYVRRGSIFAPMSIEVLQQWLEKCVELAVRTQDDSLVESLIYTLGDYRKYLALESVVQQVLAERGSWRIVKVLNQQIGRTL